MNIHEILSRALTVPSQLVIIPISSIAWFAVCDGVANMDLTGETFVMDLVPGSLAFRDEASDGIYKKAVTATIADTGTQSVHRLEILSVSDVIAVFVDGRNIVRVCGSPDYPAKLSYEVANGYVSLSLAATGVQPNPALP